MRLALGQHIESTKHLWKTRLEQVFWYLTVYIYIESEPIQATNSAGIVTMLPVQSTGTTMDLICNPANVLLGYMDPLT